MEVINTDFEGVFLLKPKIFSDERGYFFESYREHVLMDLGINCHFVQDNEAMSSYGVLRGLHYQLYPHAQAKLVRVISGKVLDVVVDIREGSETYGKHLGIILDGEDKMLMYVPKGFAHGYVCLSEKAIFSYKVDAYYNAQAEGGIRWNDPSLNIDWKIADHELIISEKDRQLPYFGNHQKFEIL